MCVYIYILQIFLPIFVGCLLDLLMVSFKHVLNFILFLGGV